METSQVDCLPLWAVGPVAQRGQGCLDLRRWRKGEIGNRTGHRVHPHLTARLAGPAGGTVADECGEHLDHIVVGTGGVAPDGLQGVTPPIRAYSSPEPSRSTAEVN